jgi:hypothetical protein
MWPNKTEDTLSKEEIDALRAAAQENAEIKAQLEAQKTEFGSQLETLRASLDSLNASRTAPVVEQQTQNDGFDFADPEGSMNRRLQPVENLAVRTQAELTEIKARQLRPKDFQLFGKEIEEIAAKDPLALKARPEYWSNLCDMLRGRNTQKIEEAAAKGEYLFTEGATGSSGNHDTGKPTLSASEARSAEKFGMTAEEWIKNRDKVAKTKLGESIVGRSYVN